MGFLDRIGKVVRAEISAVVRPDPSRRTTPPTAAAPGASTTPPAPRAPLVTDIDGALRVLELGSEPTLDEVRRRARQLARHFHPKTASTDPEETRAARLVVEAIAEAQELLEEHLLPVAPVPPSTPPTAVVDG